MRSFLSLRACALALILVLLAGCSTDQSFVEEIAVLEPARVPADSNYAALLEGVGGREALVVLLESASDAELEATLAAYGMGYEALDQDDLDALAAADEALGKDITSCPQRFPTGDRTKWFRLEGAGGYESHYIDSRGRPATAYKSLGPIVTAPRQTTCQANVGNWEDPGSLYDGGHLIGSQLGGWGGRANLVPQQYNFNRGNWKRVEDRLARCGRLGSGAVRFYADVDYPNSTTLTPSQFHADVQIAGQWKSADFLNQSGGGSNGYDQATSMVNWLSGKGCY
jgi:hypothetical protein